MKRLREQGYRVGQMPHAMVSADGYMVRYTVGEAPASDDDIMRISGGLDHLPTGPDFEVGQAVQLLSPIQPANIPAGAVATVLEVWPGIVVIEKGANRVQVNPSMIQAFPLAEAQARRR